MVPIWICLDCENISFGWAQGDCIYCGSSRVIGTDNNAGGLPGYRLLYLAPREWRALTEEAQQKKVTPRGLIAAREQAQPLLIRQLANNQGHLVLLKTGTDSKRLRQAS